MAISCPGVSARMMELLYGELSADDRAAIEAHLAGCESCRAERAGFENTRAAARRTLDADAPPARAHQAILRAAAAAVAAKQPKPIEARVAARPPSFWERWRARWTLPTFATLGAVAVVVVASKVFLEPEKTVELGRQAVQSAPAEEPTASPVTEPGAAAKPAAAKPAAAKEKEQAKLLRPAPAEKKRKDQAPEGLQPSIAHDAPARSIAAPSTIERRRAAPADGFGALDGLAKGGGTAGSGRAKAPASGGASFEDDEALALPAAPKPAKREFAPPPPPRAEPTRPSAPAANQLRERDTEGGTREEAEAPPRGSVGHLAAASAAPVADKADARSETRAEPNQAAESPVARADRLFAQGQWAAAARAYRELLRRDPHSGDAARWRQRLAASEQAASAQAPPASPASRGH